MSIFAVEYVYDAADAAGRDERRPEHRAWLGTLIEDGRVLATGVYGDGGGALLLFSTETETALLELLKEDPFNQAGLVAGMQVREWLPGMGVLSQYL